MPRSWRQFFRPSGQLLLSQVTAVTAVMKQGETKPHDTNIGGGQGKFRVSQGGGSALGAPSVADGGAAEFDVAITGAGPWEVTVTWLAAGLQALGLGTTTRTITITSAGATNSPLAIPVRIMVL